MLNIGIYIHLITIYLNSVCSPYFLPSHLKTSFQKKIKKMPSPPYPLHESVRDRLHPDYAAFYNKHLVDQQQVHFRSVEESRTSGVLIPGAGPKLPVGKEEDVAIKRKESEGPDVKVRCFTPIVDEQKGEKVPEAGWPVLVYYHGGGWVLGNIDTENVVCTNICARARCVVVTVDYR